MNAYPDKYTVNGYKLSIINMKTSNVYVGCIVNNGGIHESTELCGINHLLEHILMDAWEKCGNKSCFTYWDKHPVSINGVTSNTNVKYYINGLRKKLSSMLEYIVDIIVNPKITEENINHEKEIVLNELKGFIDSPENLLIHKMNKTLYKKVEIINNSDYYLQIKNLRRISSSKIINYYKEKYLPNNIEFCVVGKFNEQQTTEIYDMFKMLIKKNIHTNVYRKQIFLKDVFTNESRIIYHKNTSAENTSFYITIPIKLLPTQLNALHILSNIMQVKLFDLLRIQKKLVYGVSIGVDNYYYGSETCIYGSCLDSNIKTVLLETMAWLYNLATLPIKQNELSVEKDKYILSMNDTKITPEIICDFFQDQNHIQYGMSRKKIYTYGEHIQQIQQLQLTALANIQNSMNMKSIVIGYTSKYSANIHLSNIVP